MHIAVDAPSPFGRLTIACNEDALFSALTQCLPLSVLHQCPLKRHSATRYTLHPNLLGGKGGFGSQLRAAGSRKKRKKHNNDAARDASGRRIATLKQAKQLAEALRDLPGREAAQREEKRTQLEKCIADAEGLAGRRVKFDDEEYLEVSENLLEGIGYALEEAYAEDADSGDGKEEASALIDQSSRAAASKESKNPRKLAQWDEDDDDSDDEDNKQESVSVTIETPQSHEEEQTTASLGDLQPTDESAIGGTQENGKSRSKGKAPARKRRK